MIWVREGVKELIQTGAQVSQGQRQLFESFLPVQEMVIWVRKGVEELI